MVVKLKGVSLGLVSTGGFDEPAPYPKHHSDYRFSGCLAVVGSIQSRRRCFGERDGIDPYCLASIGHEELPRFRSNGNGNSYADGDADTDGYTCTDRNSDAYTNFNVVNHADRYFNDYANPDRYSHQLRLD